MSKFLHTISIVTELILSIRTCLEKNIFSYFSVTKINYVTLLIVLVCTVEFLSIYYENVAYFVKKFCKILIFSEC